ncbi:MAG: TauD/TfdA dioxygenase family protein [Phenylobacterium sp.]
MERQGLAAIEAVLQRERRTYQCIGVRPLSPIIGAEVEGLDLRLDPTPAQIAELRRAYLEHHVLVFRDQLLSEEDHLRIASLLGAVRGNGRWAVTTPAPDAGESPEPVMLAESWRADETYCPAPPAASVLHIHRLPRLGAGGDMLFANMHLAYDLLSEPLQTLLTGLTAIHKPSFAAAEANVTAEHPVVIRHPVTGRPAIFVNRQHTSHIVQLDAANSEATLKMLFRHLESHPVLTCRIRWTPNALVAWDNHSTQHLTLQDFRPRCLAGHVVSINGERPEPWSLDGIQGRMTADE